VGKWPHRCQFGPIAAVDGGPVTIGFFDDLQGRVLTLVVNRDYRRASTLTVRPRSSGEKPDRFDVPTGRWMRDEGLRLDVSAGGAVLLRWRE
jgi:hypothetical protein